MVLMAGSAAAQQAQWAHRVQMGVRAGVFSQDMELVQSDIATDAVLGWNAALVSRILLTPVGVNSSVSFDMALYVQPEIVYSQNSYKMQPPGGKVSRINMQDIDVPILLSFQVAIVRIQAGPVFNLMHKTPTKEGDLDFSSIRPTVGFGVGASVDIWKGFVLDGRYNGQFKKLQDNIKMGDKPAQSGTATLSSWSLGLSYLF